jgi:hypothetical protein
MAPAAAAESRTNFVARADRALSGCSERRGRSAVVMTASIRRFLRIAGHPRLGEVGSAADNGSRVGVLIWQRLQHMRRSGRAPVGLKITLGGAEN